MQKDKNTVGRSAVERPKFVKHYNQEALARRWGVSPRTLERWRWLKIGPRYLKLGGHVAYREDDVEAYESARARG